MTKVVTATVVNVVWYILEHDPNLPKEQLFTGSVAIIVANKSILFVH